MRAFGPAILLGCLPAAAAAQGTMPQMDFANPLTTTQIFWMVVILAALYLLLSRWGLPEMGKVLEHRAAVIAKDLAEAHAAKLAADQAVASLNATMKQARNSAQAQIADAVNTAKAEAAVQAAALAARLDAKLAASEAQIAAAHAQAMAAIKPVAESAAASILQRLTGAAPDGTALAASVDLALANGKAA